MILHSFTDVKSDSSAYKIYSTYSTNCEDVIPGIAFRSFSRLFPRDSETKKNAHPEAVSSLFALSPTPSYANRSVPRFRPGTAKRQVCRDRLRPNFPTSSGLEKFNMRLSSASRASYPRTRV